jgi:hypothetical protein
MNFNFKNLNSLFKKLNDPKNLYFVIIIVILISIFAITNTNCSKKLLEGLENQDNDKKDKDNASDNSVGTKLINYSSDIKKKNIFMNDSLLISKYKKEMEEFIIKLEEYSNNLMIYKLFSVSEQSNTFNPDNNDSMNSTIQEMEKVNTIKNFIDSLNTSIKYIDSKT